jgi:hypothetical protein
MMGFGAGGMEMEEEFFLQKITYVYTQIELTTLVQVDTSFLFRIMLRDVLEEESL